MNTFVYFVRPKGRVGPIKIGCSREPVTRLDTLMAWAPVPLEIVTTIPGDLKLERRIHGVFAAAHSHREWFHATPELVAVVDALRAGRPIGELIDLNAPIVRFRTTRKRSEISSDRCRYLSYAAKLRIRFRALSPAKRRFEPADVDGIMFRWSGYQRRAPITPTAEEFARLEQVIADPAGHAVALENRWPPKVAA